MEITEEEIKKVMDFDNKVQDDGKIELENDLAYIYEYAKGKEEGWRGIAKHDPDSFKRALKLAEAN